MKATEKIREILFVIANLYQLLIGVIAGLIAIVAMLGIAGLGIYFIMMSGNSNGLPLVILLVVTIGISFIIGLLPLLGIGVLLIAPSIPAVIRLKSNKKRVKAKCAVINAGAMTLASTIVQVCNILFIITGFFNLIAQWGVPGFTEPITLSLGILAVIEIVTLIAFLADAALLVLTLIVEIPVLKNKDANNIC
ncbi:MAG: hypothetical protein K5988_08720 [Lachnospiraceae bacterium]|nr:hypothetical protein [Lachnospiraceae bacterium]